MVRDWFFPEQVPFDPYSDPPSDMRQSAINMVQIWLSKEPKLSHAIIATAHLTEAILHDEPQRRPCISDWASRAIHAMAFCRFVNGFVDRDVAKSASAPLKIKMFGSAASSCGEESVVMSTVSRDRGESSMFAYAERIGMPIGFVELRHSATHDEMPELGVLRGKVQDALDWLWERWWRINATGDPGRALRARELARVEAEEREESGDGKGSGGQEAGPADEDQDEEIGAACSGDSIAQGSELYVDGEPSSEVDPNTTLHRKGKRRRSVEDMEVARPDLLKKAMRQEKARPVIPVGGQFDALARNLQPP